MNPRALGWDNHRKFSKVSLMEQTPDGEIRAVERARLDHDDKEAMQAWLSHLDPEMPVALEATFGWPWVADLLEGLGHPVHLGHPPVIRALAKHEAKTDRCDSDRLGKFQLRGILPESYLAPPEVRQRRERTRYRMALSALRTAVKNRVQAILHRHGILHDFSDLFGKAGRAFSGRPGIARRLAASPARIPRLARQADVVDRRSRAVDDREPGRGRDRAAVDDDSGHRSDPGPRDPCGNRRNRAFSHVPALGQLRRTGADKRRHGGPRRAAALQRGLQPRAALGLHRGGAWRATDQGPARSPTAATLRTAVRPGRPKGRKSSAKVAVAHELSKLVHVVWTKRVPYTDTPPPRPGSREGRRQTQGVSNCEDNVALGPAPSPYGPPPGNRRPDPLVIGPSDAAYPFCAGRVACTARNAGRKRLPQHVGIVGFTPNREMLSDHIGFTAVGPQVDEEESRRVDDRPKKRPTPRREAGPSTRGSQATLGSHPCVALSSA